VRKPIAKVDLKGCAPRRLGGSLDLQQRHPGMIEKHPPRSRQLDSARAADQERNPQLQFEIVDLPAQRRLRGVQPLLRRHRQAAFFGDGDEITEVTQLHG
jgi:hypothetical protein